MEHTSTDSLDAAPGARFLPDFCGARVLIEILIIAEVVAMILTMARGLLPGSNVMQDFIALSLFMLWIALSCAAVLCLARRFLVAVQASLAYLACYGLLLLTTVVVSLLAVLLDDWLQLQLIGDAFAGSFLSRNLSISAIISALALRYFYVQYQWKRQVEREADSRIEALQARIRPHFLFNSMNTIAALIPFKPAAAEQAVEDLSDLFRASLAEARSLVSLQEEVELAQLYVRLEKLRLEERLEVEWNIPADAFEVQLPRLTLQPLLENAIHHGIEASPEGGRIEVSGRTEGKDFILTISNPMERQLPRRDGFRIALENTRERLNLALGEQAQLVTAESEAEFKASLVLPRSPA